MLEALTYNNSTIHFGSLKESSFNDLLENQYANSKKIIITDETVSGFWMEDLITSFQGLSNAEIIQIPPGEEFKTIEVCTQIWEALSEYKIGRKDLIINFGGGVITDMGGFIASIFKRGMDFINIPTTLLSQVDASVGGKTGVDLGAFKNQIGVFADAKHVFIDPSYLSTLDTDQLLSGYAEMLKHGLIQSEDHWTNVTGIQEIKNEISLDLIRSSVAIKHQVVEQDHKESGIRKILNFGHTIGHGIEGYMLSKGSPILHGYAVAWGMLAEAQISKIKGLISEDLLTQIKELIVDRYPKIELDASDFKEVMKLMYNDKKNSNDRIHFSLINGLGSAVWDQEVSDKEILEALKFIS